MTTRTDNPPATHVLEKDRIERSIKIMDWVFAAFTLLVVIGVAGELKTIFGASGILVVVGVSGELVLHILIVRANKKVSDLQRIEEVKLKNEIAAANERTANADKLASEARERSVSIIWRLRGFGLHGSVRKAVGECGRRYAGEKMDIFFAQNTRGLGTDMLEFFWQPHWEIDRWEVVSKDTFVDICVTVRKGASEHTKEVAQAVGDAFLFPHKAAILEFSDARGLEAPFAYDVALSANSGEEWTKRNTKGHDIRLWIGRQIWEDLGVYPPFPPFSEPKESIFPKPPSTTSDSPTSPQ